MFVCLLSFLLPHIMVNKDYQYKCNTGRYSKAAEAAQITDSK